MADQVVPWKCGRFIVNQVYLELIFIAKNAHKYLEQGGRVILVSLIATGIGLPGHAVYAGSKSAVSQTDFGEKRCTVTQTLRLYAVTTTNRHLAGNSEPKDATHGKDLIRPHSRSSYYLARPTWIAL